MNFKRTGLAILAAMAMATAAQAQTSRDNFVGNGFGLTVSSVRNSLDVSSTTAFDWAATSAGVGLTSSYGFEMTKSLIGTVGFEYGLKNTDYSTVVSGGVSNNAVAKNHWNISFAPGIRVSNDSLIYVKLGFHQLDVNYNTSSGLDVTKTHTGTGIGVGYAIAVSPSFEFRTEYESVDYGAQNTSTTVTAKPKQQNLNFAFVAKF